MVKGSPSDFVYQHLASLAASVWLRSGAGSVIASTLLPEPHRRFGTCEFRVDHTPVSSAWGWALPLPVPCRL